MTKKALCVGINNYPFGDDNDLRGCLNDADDWASLLKNHFDFTDVKMLTDADATKSNLIANLKELVKGAKSGDVLAFTNASHGTYRACKDDNEPLYDEALCPYDCDSNLVIDNDLRELFANLKKGVHLTVILDSCHSGSGTRAMLNMLEEYRRPRFLNPKQIRNVVLEGDEMERARQKRKNQREKHPESGMKEILLSGCKSNQTSADAFIEGDYHGAMTYHTIKAIRDAKYKITYAGLHRRLEAMLGDANFDQAPQLEGRDENKARQIFT